MSRTMKDRRVDYSKKENNTARNIARQKSERKKQNKVKQHIPRVMDAEDLMNEDFFDDDL